MRRMHSVLLVALILSGVLVADGAVLLVISSRTTVSTGWFAYQPMSDSLFVPSGFVMLTQSAIAGVVVMVVGLIGLGAAVGCPLGRRGRADE